MHLYVTMEAASQSHALAATRLTDMVQRLKTTGVWLRTMEAIQRASFAEKRAALRDDYEEVYKIVLHAQLRDITASLVALHKRIDALEDNVRCMEMARALHERAPYSMGWSPSAAGAGADTTRAKEGTREGVSAPEPLPPATRARGLMYRALATALTPKPSDT